VLIVSKPGAARKVRAANRHLCLALIVWKNDRTIVCG